MEKIVREKDEETKEIQTGEFDLLQIRIASEEEIRSWSHGEVKKAETINYRTSKPEKDGLFCAKIFGPTKDFECLCGKYKKLKHKGIVCEKCGVEVTFSRVRRERMGHIELAHPIVHTWFFKSSPSYIANLLDFSLRSLEKVLYFESYVVIDPGNACKLVSGNIINEEEYIECKQESNDFFSAESGANAIKYLLENLDIHEEIFYTRWELTNCDRTKYPIRFNALVRRLKALRALRSSDNTTSSMVLTVLPVLPPDLRPIVPIDGCRFASSDLNDLYRRVINRNNRLKRLLELGAPDIIVRNEKRMLQEAVDVLFDNGRRGRTALSNDNRPLKSLSDMLKGKQGRFRQNLLGKRVDYSGRSVIIVGPTLRLHQCGIPKRMLLELFKPFVLGRLQAKGLAPTIKAARKMIELEAPDIWDALEESVHQHPVLLNRAPTLHRLGLQAFDPVPVEGKAIQLHPLVCSAFNADFDGDQMAVHVPLTLEAQLEARVLMMSTNNVLHPANGETVITPTQDVVIGLHYMTKENYNTRKDVIFSNPKEVILAYEASIVGLHDHITLRTAPSFMEHGSPGQLLVTTPGRIILWSIMPKGMPFVCIDKVMNKKGISEILNLCSRTLGTQRTVMMVDDLMRLGYKYATSSGVSIGISDMIIPGEKQSIVEETEKEVIYIQKQYFKGFMANPERYNKTISLWANANSKIGDAMMDAISKDEKNGVSFNPVYMMSDSGARSSPAQIRQLAGMRGLMAKPDGTIIEIPITANFREGLTVLQYFISAHGARKGLADTALKTANAGYLTRRLVDASQDVIISAYDCKTKKGIEINPNLDTNEFDLESFRNRIKDRICAKPVYHPDGGITIVSPNTVFTNFIMDILKRCNVNTVTIRSPVTCELEYGICSRCYGKDLSRNEGVDIGVAAGIIAAQSIGEPGTQLTMRTFHIGGIASETKSQDNIKSTASGIADFCNMKTVTNSDDKVICVSYSARFIVKSSNGREIARYKIPYGAQIHVKRGDRVDSQKNIASWDAYTVPVITESNGNVQFVNLSEGITFERLRDNMGNTVRVVRNRTAKYKGSIRSAMLKIVTKHGGDIFVNPSSMPLSYMLLDGAIISVQNKDEVLRGDVIARMPLSALTSSDITGGLPRISDLFEARKPRDPAVLSPISGVVEMNDDEGDGKVVQLRIVGTKGSKIISVPSAKRVNVCDGDKVARGEVIADGVKDLTDILNILGLSALTEHIVNEIQEIYKTQGVNIDNKHIEVIIRQMLKMAVVEEQGDTNYAIEDIIPYREMANIHEIVAKNGGRPPKFRRLVTGITKAALQTKSFMSGASFQETVRILTAAALGSKYDYLTGLKENVMTGRLIPAGTGHSHYYKETKECRSRRRVNPSNQDLYKEREDPLALKKALKKNIKKKSRSTKTRDSKEVEIKEKSTSDIKAKRKSKQSQS